MGGGALLAKPATEISLLDVYRAVENCELFTLHRSPPNKSCIVGEHVQAAMRPALDRAQDALERELAHVMIADIASDIAHRGEFTIPWKG